MKTQILALVAGFLLSATAQAGLIAYYSFDGADGTDNSGNGNDAIANGGVSFTSNGVSGGAAVFDGIDDFFSTSLLTNFSQATFSAWFKSDKQDPNGSHAAEVILGNEEDQGSGRNGYGLELRYGTQNVWFTLGEAGNADVAQSPSPFVAGEWNHIVGVSTGSQLQLYLNGGLVASSATARSPSSTKELNIGRTGYDFSSPSTLKFFSGELDEIGIYDEALSSDQVSELYSAVPEPLSIALMASGLLILGTTRRDRV